MNPDTVKAIQEALAPIAAKLGQGAEFIYAAYYRQVIIDGALQIVIPIILAVTLYVFGRKWIRFAMARHENVKDESYYDYEWVGAAYGPTGLLAAILLVAALFSVPDGISMLLNPHYHTIHRLFESVRGQ